MGSFDFTFDNTFEYSTTTGPGPIDSVTPPQSGIYGDITTKAGNIRIHLLDGNPVEEVEITAVGSLKYEFDLVPDKPEVDAVQALYEKIDVELFQYGFNNTDLFDRLIDSVRELGGVRVNLLVDTFRFSFYISLNDIELSEVDRLITLECRVLFDETTTVLSVFDSIPYNLIRDFIPDAVHSAEILDATGVADWIGEAMREVFLNDFDSLVLSARTGLSGTYTSRNYSSLAGGITDRTGFIMARIEGDDFITYEDLNGDLGRITYEGGTTWSGFDFLANISAGDRFTIFTDFGDPILANILIVSVDSDTQFTSAEPNTSLGEIDYRWRPHIRKDTEQFTAIEALQELATIEGAIYGTGFDRNFYVNRILDKEIVDIPWSDITEMKPKPFWNPFKGGQVTQIARTYTDADNQTVNSGFDNFGVIPTSGRNWQLPLITDGRSAIKEVRSSDYTINLSLPPGYPFLNKAQGSISENAFVGKYNDHAEWYLDFEPSIALCRSGLRAIRKALASDGQSLYVDFTAFNSKRVKPWNLMRIVDGVNAPAPEQYKDRVFRSTSIEYDFVRDMATYEAYEILDSDLPDLGLEPSVSGESSSSGEVVIAITRQIEVSGTSQSTGEVGYSVIGTTFRQVSGASEATGSVSYRVDKFVSVAGESTSAGEVTTGAGETLSVSGIASSGGSVTTQVS